MWLRRHVEPKGLWVESLYRRWGSQKPSTGLFCRIDQGPCPRCAPCPGVESPVGGLLSSKFTLKSGAEPSSMTSGAHDKLLALGWPALHPAEEYLIQSDGTKLFSVRLLPDLSILKHEFEPGPEEKIVFGWGSCDEGVGTGAAILSSTTKSLWESETLRVSISDGKAREKGL